jgi:hypothetical protein
LIGNQDGVEQPEEKKKKKRKTRMGKRRAPAFKSIFPLLIRYVIMGQKREKINARLKKTQGWRWDG